MTESFLFYPLILFVFTIVAHGIILFYDGLCWDGWIVDSWQRRRDWKTMKKFYLEVGMPLLYYQHRIIGNFPNKILFYRIIAFTSTYVSALAIYFISTHLGFMNNTQALFLSILYLTYTGYHMNIDNIVGLQYTFPTCLFYCSVFISLISDGFLGYEHWGIRVVSIIIFTISFNMNSLLVYYFGFLVLKSILFFKYSSLSLHGVYEFSLHNFDYIILPFIFWFFKERLAPRCGQYSSYNRIRLNFGKILKSYISLFRFGFEGSITNPIFFIFNKRYIWIPLFMTLFIYLLPYNRDEVIDNLNIDAGIILYGVILLVLAGLPYILVNQPFCLDGWGTKNSALLHLPVALIILGLIHIVFPAQSMGYIVMFIAIVFSIYINMKYMHFIAVYVKNRSWLYHLSKYPGSSRISIYQIVDNHFLRGDSDPHNEHKSAYLVYMFEWLWGDVKRFGIPELKIRNLPYTEIEIKKEIDATTLNYALDAIDIAGLQARVTIKSGNIDSYFYIARTYIVATIFHDHDKLNYLFENAASIDYYEYTR